MKKYWSLFILIPFFSVISCMDDTSAYLPQEKEDVNVENNFKVDTTDTDSVLPEGELAPGLHLVKIKVLQPNYPEPIERQFKYYMPVTINPAKPISLIFDFHGSYTFESGEKPGNPMAGTTETNPFNQLATTNNCIICYPAALPIFQPDSSGTVNWMDSENHLPFVDALIKYFTVDNEPYVDPNRIYSTGHSSGAIFSFVLAFERPEVFAAIAPRAGQMSIKEETVMPPRAVPVRVFAGETDENVVHHAVLENMTDWAERIGGYFASDMKTDKTTYEGYADVTIRYWHGGVADYEIYSLAGIGHDINATKCMDDLWDFFDTHPMDLSEEKLFISTNYKEIDAQCGEPFGIKVNYTEGATFVLPDFPRGWTIKAETRGGIESTGITLVAPADYYGAVDRKGVITFTVTKNGQTATCDINYVLNAPKTYFEVGDVYYNDKFEAAGVVCWVNPDNIKEAKIISLTGGISRKVGFFSSGLTTPDLNDGEVNTAKYVEENTSAGLGSTAANSAFIWAADYSYKGISNWYLPAINEISGIYKNKTRINEALQVAGGAILPVNYCVSSTVTLESGKTTYYELNFKTGAVSRETAQYADDVIIVKKVTK